MHIAPYEQGNIFNKDPLRPRRLLMHKREIMRLYGKVKQDGYALIPLSVYFRGSLVKVEVALASSSTTGKIWTAKTLPTRSAISCLCSCPAAPSS